MRALLPLLALLVVAADAQARFAKSDTAEAIRQAELILDVQIVSSRTTDRKPANSPAATCGYIYEARIIENLKGEASSTVRFASPRSFGVGRRYLLFLNSYEGDFPTDVIMRWEHEDQERKTKCLSELPLLKASWLHFGTFLPDDFIQLSYWLVPPANTQPAEILIERVRSRGGVVDLTKPFEAQSNAPEVESLLLHHEIDSL